MALRRNILLFHQGALGDFVVTWPLALGLGRVLAQSRIFYVTGGQKGALAERALRVESVDVEGGWHHLFARDPQLPEPATKLLNGAQWIIGFGAEAGDLWVKNLAKLAPEAKVIALSTTPAEDFKGHITEYIAGQLRPWPVMATAMEQMLKSVATRGIMGVPANAGGAVVIHPGAGAERKCWPAAKYLELAGEISRSGRAVEVILGEVETERWPGAQIESFAKMATVSKPKTVLELWDRISKASAFIGNDSGPGHLAGMLGVPTISIFGPNDPARWRPVGPGVEVVQGEWNAISPGRIAKMLRG